MAKTQAEEVVPEGEGPVTEAITMRFPKKLLERVERCAKKTANNRTDTCMHLMRWALDQFEAKEGK